MFTGLITDLGKIVEIFPDGEGISLRIAVDFSHSLELGESIAVSGVCLSVTAFDQHSFTVYAMPETLKLTTLGKLAPGDLVNLERALCSGDRLGGHMVSGHVDQVVQVESVTDGEGWRVLRIALTPELSKQMVWKGSVSLAGVSLTISALTESYFEVSLIPVTCEHTTLGAAAVGDYLNLEVDMISKYVARMLEPYLPLKQVGDE